MTTEIMSPEYAPASAPELTLTTNEGAQTETTAQDLNTSSEGTSRSVIELLIRSPQAFVENLEHYQRADVQKLLGISIVGSTGFGVVLGAYRGGIQILYCAIKFPMLLLVTLMVCVPAFIGIARAFGQLLSAKAIATLSVGIVARFSLVLAGLAPAFWLMHGWLSYHSAALATFALCAIAGVVAVGLLFTGLSHQTRSRSLSDWTAVLFLCVFAGVSLHTSWLFRPFLVRPKTTDIPFLRPIEGDLSGSVRQSAISATGSYSDQTGDWLRSAPRLVPTVRQRSE